MRTILTTGMAAIIDVALCASCPAAQDEAEKHVTFRMAKDVLPAGGVRLANGIVVLSTDWPTLAMTKIKLDAGFSTCTATLVGPTVALLAAHCVENILSTTARQAWLKVDTWEFPLVCDMHPAYVKREPLPFVPRGPEDYGLCLIRTKGIQPASFEGISFEVLDSKSPLGPNDAVLMTGYGCDDLKIVAGRLEWNSADGNLRIGEERIDTGIAEVPNAPTYVTVRSAVGKDPALCPGDSGGPLFSGITVKKPDESRRVRGVNSKVAPVRNETGVYEIISSISATGTSVFHTWAESWLEQHITENPIICGVNRAAGEYPCRK